MKSRLISILFALIILLLFAETVVALEISQITHDPAMEYNPWWSPDGREIAFLSCIDGNVDIWVMDGDGSNRRQLTLDDSVEGFSFNPWSPDGDRILFVLNISGNFDLWVMNADGSGKKRLTYGADVEEAVWSTDGRKIVFVSNASGNRDIWIMNSDGSGKTRLTKYGGDDINPRWQPHGDKIAFLSERSGNFDLWIMNSDGSGKMQLTSTEGNERDISWSPDGRKIVFVSVSALNRSNASSCINFSSSIWVMNADGSGKRELCSGKGFWSFSPEWSPDGRKIAFHSFLKGENSHIWMVNSDGTEQLELTSGNASDITPRWFPDGRKILFVSDSSGNLDIWVMTFEEDGATTPTLVSIQPPAEEIPGFDGIIAGISLLITSAVRLKRRG